MVQSLINNLQQVFDAMNIGLLIETADRTVAYANKKVLCLFGLEDDDPSKIIGVRSAEIAETLKHCFVDAETVGENAEGVPAGERPAEANLETRKGKFLLRKYTPIKDDDGITHHLWTYEDITELVKKQNQLRAQRSFLEKVLNEIPADIAIFSPEHKYLFVNKAGIKDDELRAWIIDKDDYEYAAYRGYDKAVADTRRERFNQVKDTRESVSWVDEVPMPDGATEYILRIYSPYIDDSDELELIIGYGVNITDQKVKEQEAAQAKERFSSMVSSLKDGVFQCDYDGNIITGNDTIRTMIDDVIPIEEGKPANIFAIVHDDDIDKLMIGADELRRTKIPQRGVVRLKPNRQGEIKYVDSYVWLQNDVDHGVLYTGRISDITEQMLKQEQMKKVIEKEKDLNQLKSNFIHITSHELRTPLSVVLSSAEILDMILSMDEADRPDDVDPKQFTDSIAKEVRNITDILNEMLMVSRIERGALQYRPEPIDIGYYLNAIAEEQYSPFEDGRTLNIDVKLKDSKAFIDIKLMRHAVANLLNNAFKYSKGKEAPTLKASNCEDGSICIEVIDHGIGIPDADKEMLFNSFFRASNVGNISGNGIGLMVVDHVMKVHEGKVEVKSKVNQGTSFTLVIPNKTTR